MVNASPTLAQLFALDPADSNSRVWDEFRDKLKKEAEDIRWPVGADLSPEVTGLFNIPITRIFLGAWEKAEALREQLELSRQTPEDTFSLSLSEHALTSEFHPRIDVKVGSATVKKITFTVRLSLTLNSVELRIKKGRITHINAGRFSGSGSILYADFKLASKEFASFELLPRTPIGPSGDD
jgi:hypothetical protein